MNYLDDFGKNYKKNNSETFDDYRQVPLEKMKNYNNEKLSDLPISNF